MTASIICELVGFDRCECGGIAVKHNAPVLTMCRALLGAGSDPAAPLHAYRNGTLCLRIKTLAKGAKLTVEEGPNGPKIARYKAPRTLVARSPMRQNARAARGVAEAPNAHL